MAPSNLSLLEWVDSIADQFEAAWQSGSPPDIADFLEKSAGERRSALLAELVRIDLAYRRRAGEARTAADYAARFPEVLRQDGTPLRSLARLSTPSVPGPTGTDPPSVPGYEILSELGRGGMGVVYKARQTSLNRRVALKVIRSGPQIDPEQLARFRTEAEAVARLQHPGIVQIFEVGEHGGVPYFSLELVEGGNLASRLDGTPLPLRAAAELVETLARAMHAAHARGIVHRDLKPANILLQNANCKMQNANLPGDHLPFAFCNFHFAIPKISDFGLAKVVSSEPGTPAAPGLTQTGAIVGTPSYMAPEQAAGKKDVGPAADIWALGAILYECLTGRPPFKAATVWDTLAQVIAEEPVSPRRLQSQTPRDLETICLKCLRKPPGQRYPTGRDLADDLHRFLDGQPIRARPVGWGERTVKWMKRRPAQAALLGAALLGLVVLAGAAWWYYEDAQASRAEALVQSLTTADIAQVPQLIKELEPYRRWANPLLVRRAAELPAESRERLHVSLALAEEDDAQTEYLYGWLLRAAPEELPVIQETLFRQRASLVGRLWPVLRGSEANANQRLRAACCLAAYDPNNPSWKRVRGDVADILVKENPLRLSHWTRALRPVRATLVSPLGSIFRDARRPESEHSVAANLLADYAAERPEDLADLVLDADQRYYALLLDKLKAHPQPAVRRMHEVLDQWPMPVWKEPPPRTLWPPDRTLVRQIEAADGLVAEHFALCQTLPLEQFDRLAERLRPSGYRPIRLRPYAAAGNILAAVIWMRDSRDWHLALGLTATELRRRDRHYQSLGLLPMDVAAYPANGNRFAVLWVKSNSPGEQGRLQVEVPDGPQNAALDKLKKDGFLPVAVQAMVTGDDWPRYSMLWQKGSAAANLASNFERRLDQAGYDGAHLDLLPVDVSLTRRTDTAAQLAPELPAWLTGAPAAGLAGMPWAGFYQRWRWPLAPGEDRWHAGLWQARTDREGVKVFASDPAHHLLRCRQLAQEGYRPAAIAAAWLGSDRPLATASIWHRIVISEADRDALARRQAQAAVTLLHLGRPERVWPLLQHRPDPRVRSFLIHLLSPLGTDPRNLARRLEEEPDVSARRALVLCLGSFGGKARAAIRRGALVERLLHIYRDHPDPGLHSAVDWLMRRWGYASRLERIDKELVGKPPGRRLWYVAHERHTLAVVSRPRDFVMGSPVHEPDRVGPNETPHRVHIPRSFAIATREVTVAQFRRFLEANPDVKRLHSYLPKYSPVDDGPIISVTWYEAAQYCNWLSKQDQVDESQWCYPREIKEGMKLPADFLRRQGYRLSTEAEWEYACRAGAVTSRFYGFSEALLKEYAWYLVNAPDERTGPVGQSKPNDLGLFDSLGNVLEWCHDAADPYQPAPDGRVREDRADAGFTISADSIRALRGGSFYHNALNIRAASRLADVPGMRNPAIGLRVARTWVER
jgi:formylglycine-generating enzyme required for sulfatase activity